MNLRSRLNVWCESLTETSNSLFGQISLRMLLIVSTFLVAKADLGYVAGEPGLTMSIFGFALPDMFFESRTLFDICCYGFYAAAVCWFFQRFVPFSSWLTAVLYTMVASIYWENLPWFRETYVLPCWLLLIYALWFHFYRREIRAAITKKEFLQTPLFPKWAYSGSVYCIAMSFTFSGLTKLYTAGIAWDDGLSLQIWTKMLAATNTPLTHFILSNRTNALILQSGFLLLECLAFLAILTRGSRTVIGIGLVGFHVMFLLTLGSDFLSNTLLVGLFLLPFFDYAPTIKSRIESALGYSFSY